MAGLIRTGIASWPGVLGVISCHYTMSQGISPGIAMLKFAPQDPKTIAMSGTLTIGDGFAGVKLPDCTAIDDQQSGDPKTGFISSLRILDRRWKWRGLGQISGFYNQLDKHAKLLPETIRSPEEIAILCLQAMGETVYTIHLPPGLTRKDGVNWQGINPPWYNAVSTTNTNPPINWEAGTVNPAAALAELCDLYSCRIALQASNNSVFIGPIGIGQPLPDGSISKESISINQPATPSSVAAAGGPTFYQMRLLMRAVALEWHGEYVPIEIVSYRPAPNPQPQITKITIQNPQAGERYQLFVNAPMDQNPTLGFLAEYVSAGGDANIIAFQLATIINNSANPQILGVATALAVGRTLTLTSAAAGITFRVFARIGNNGFFTSRGGSIVSQLMQPANNGFGSNVWAFCTPSSANGFQSVRETNHLSRLQAIERAKASVFKAYQVANIDASGRGPIKVPGITRPLVRRRQVILTPFQVEQIVPEAPEPGLFDPRERLGGDQAQLAIKNFYSGWPKSKPAVAYGAISKGIQQRFWRQDMGISNTRPIDQIFIDFETDPDNQIIVFSDFVYRYTSEGAIGPARVILETGVNIRNTETNAVECYAYPIALPGASGPSNPKIRKYQDIQRNIIGDYTVAADGSSVLTGFHDEKGAHDIVVDAVVRAKFYATSMTLPFQKRTAETRNYNGFVVVDLDAAISQVSWSVDTQKATTTASRNCEHDRNIPPLPARRREEFLDPVARVVIQQGVAPPRVDAAMNRPGV